uniref:Uncharacterized protein n=1 Tax=Leersia perrieri TaxID=77586 RepID=A0A0D9W3Y2_9ORYZ
MDPLLPWPSPVGRTAGGDGATLGVALQDDSSLPRWHRRRLRGEVRAGGAGRYSLQGAPHPLIFHGCGVMEEQNEVESSRAATAAQIF